MKHVMRTGLGRISAAAALAVGARCLDRGLAEGGYHDTRSRRSTLAGAVLAFAGPAAVTANRIRGRTVLLAPPPSAIGKAMLGSYVLAGVLAEELAWRKVLTFRLARVPKASLTLVSMAGFVLAHLPRDGGRNAAAHATNTLSWTASALTSGSIRWSVLSHWAYNCLALTLRSSEPLVRVGGRI